MLSLQMFDGLFKIGEYYAISSFHLHGDMLQI